jgi:hypothetical protein
MSSSEFVPVLESTRLLTISLMAMQLTTAITNINEPIQSIVTEAFRFGAGFGAVFRDVLLDRN